MSKRTEFRDVDDHAVVVESRADRKAWAIKFTGVTYREFDKDDAPALALAILEAAGVAVWNHSVLTYGTKEHLEHIAMNLKNYIEQGEQAKFRAMKEAADREVLEKRRNELAIQFGSSNLGYKDTFESTQRAIDRIIELEDKAKS